MNHSRIEYRVLRELIDKTLALPFCWTTLRFSWLLQRGVYNCDHPFWSVIQRTRRRAGMLDLVDHASTSKDGLHSYLHFYRWLFAAKREAARKVLEIGSIEAGAFVSGTIIFTKLIFSVLTLLTLIVSGAASKASYVFAFSRTKTPTTPVYSMHLLGWLDIMIEDGPHSLNSMRQMI